MEPHVVSNIVTGVLVVGAAAAAVAAARSPLWRDAARDLWRRRPVALAAVALYVLVALLDSIAWVGGGGGVALAPPRSVIDRMFAADFQERSYSAPLAATELYGGAPLRYPGRHLLGTDILGRDVLLLTLKGARVALLVGGLTTLIVIPIALLFGVTAGYHGGP